MTNVQKQHGHLIKALALGVLASTALLAESDQMAQSGMTTPSVQTQSAVPIPHILEPDAQTNSSKSEFIGKVQVHCAPLRAFPQPEAVAVIEIERAALLQVTGKEGDFYQVIAPANLKAYVASRYINGDSIAGEHVNIRSRPNTESAILGQLNTGNQIKAERLIKAPDWMEISFPAERRLYIRCDLIKQVLGKETFEELMQLRNDILKALTEAQALNAEAQRQLTSDSSSKISWNQVRAQYEKARTLASRSSAFSELSQSSEEQLQEAFLKYQTLFSETEQAKKVPIESIKPSSGREIDKESSDYLLTQPNIWTNVEQQHLQKWLKAHPEKTDEHYILDQQAQAQTIEGTLVAFDRPDLRQKPGDFVLMQFDLPVAYFYSGRCNLEKSMGRLIKYRVVKRDDLGFALPAYCVLSIGD